MPGWFEWFEGACPPAAIGKLYQIELILPIADVARPRKVGFVPEMDSPERLARYAVAMVTSRS